MEEQEFPDPGIPETKVGPVTIVRDRNEMLVIEGERRAREAAAVLAEHKRLLKEHHHATFFVTQLGSFLTLTGRSQRRPRPMPSALLLDIVMDPDLAKDALANLEEAFELWAERYGPARARQLMRWHILRIAARHVVDHAINRCERVVKMLRPG